jgi:hypothetical protein
MPISPITLQRRQAELGRIRLGQQITGTSKAGKTYTRPAKLDRFRFTSVSEQYIRDLADLYGGEAQTWDNNGIPSWEVVTTATSIPVIVVKGGLSQWMETWSGGGCIHRCDGQQLVDGTPCEQDTATITIKGKTYTAHEVAKPTTRLSVMLPELDAIGVFRMESHGWNAAAEIPAVAELAQFVGDLVPAVLHLVERRTIKDGETSRFVVPVLDLKIGAQKLREVVAAASGMNELEAPAQSGAPAIEGARPDYVALADDATTVEEVRGIWKDAQAAGHLDNTLKAHLTARSKEVAPEPTSEPDPSTDEVIDAEPLDEDVQAAWQKCLTVGGELGISLYDLEDMFAEANDGLSSVDATAEQMGAFLTDLQKRQAA